MKNCFHHILNETQRKKSFHFVCLFTYGLQCWHVIIRQICVAKLLLFFNFNSLNIQHTIQSSDDWWDTHRPYQIKNKIFKLRSHMSTKFCCSATLTFRFGDCFKSIFFFFFKCGWSSYNSSLCITHLLSDRCKVQNCDI